MGDRLLGARARIQADEQLERASRLVARAPDARLLYANGEALRIGLSRGLDVADGRLPVRRLQCDAGQRCVGVRLVRIQLEHPLQCGGRLGAAVELDEHLCFVQRVLGVVRGQLTGLAEQVERPLRPAGGCRDLPGALPQPGCRRGRQPFGVRDGLDIVIARHRQLRRRALLVPRRPRTNALQIQNPAVQLVRPVLARRPIQELPEDRRGAAGVVAGEILLRGCQRRLDRFGVDLRSRAGALRRLGLGVSLASERSHRQASRPHHSDYDGLRHDYRAAGQIIRSHGGGTGSAGALGRIRCVPRRAR